MTIPYLSIPAYNNYSTLKTFYINVFGWNISDYGTNYGKILENNVRIGDIDGSSLNYNVGKGVAPCISVSSINNTLEAVNAYGGSTEMSRTGVPDGDEVYYARFIDPAGNRIGLYESK